MVDNRTANLDLPLPDVTNNLEDDCPRIAAALTGLDAALASDRGQIANGFSGLGADLGAKLDSLNVGVNEGIGSKVDNQTAVLGRKFDAMSTALAGKLDAIKIALGGGDAARVVGVPVIYGDTRVLAGQVEFWRFVAVPALAGAKIHHFVVTVDGEEQPDLLASDNSARFELDVPAEATAPIVVSVLAVDDFGNKSDAVTLELEIVEAKVVMPKIILPNDGEMIIKSEGLTVTTSTFAVNGATDTHDSTDYRIATNPGGEPAIVELLASKDLVSHKFAASAISGLVNGNSYYVQARHNAKVKGVSPWSAPVMIVPRQPTKTAGGRYIYRHESDMGSVLLFDMFGEAVKLFVVDAKYRTKAAFMLGAYVDSMLTNFQDKNKGGSYYINNGSAAVGTTANVPVITDASLQGYWASLSADKTARYNCDVWMALDKQTITTGSSSSMSSNVLFVPAVSYARSLTDVFSDGCDVPNEYELMVLYLESDNIDALDPTVATNKTKALGKVANPAGRFRFDGTGYAWSSTEYNYNNVRSVSSDGNCYASTKNSESWVLPVREL